MCCCHKESEKTDVPLRKHMTAMGKSVEKYTYECRFYMKYLRLFFYSVFCVCWIWSGYFPVIHAAGTNSITDKTVVLTKNGFEPAQIRIQEGQTIRFTTRKSQPFWPASDPHPTHDIYPAFDPKEPIDASKSWFMRFDKVGSWSYHDHLAPVYGGVVIVESVHKNTLFRQAGVRILDWITGVYEKMKESSLSLFPMNDQVLFGQCQKLRLSIDEYETCMDAIFRSEVRLKGVKASLEALNRFREKDVFFAANCHVAAHAIGEAGYEEILRGKIGQVNADTSVCNFGYYHGLMQEFVSHGKNSNAAVQFCLSQTDQNNQNPYNDRKVAQCIHGVGHGLVFWHAVEGRPSELILAKQGIEECERMLKPDSLSYTQCINGIFGGIAALYFTLHGFTYEMDSADPFWVCKEQDEHVAKYCYDELLPPAFRLTGWDMAKTGAYIQKIPNEVHKAVAMEHLGKMPIVRGAVNDGDYMNIIRQCRQFGERLSLNCIHGLAWAISSTGEMSLAITRGTDVCVHAGLTKGEQDICIASIIEQLKFTYHDALLKKACNLLYEKTGVPCT